MAHRPLRVAHRGASLEHRENTLAAFARALTLGADGIELDVHVTMDGVVVVHHDRQVAVAGRPQPITGLRLATLQHDEGPGAAIPTLEQVMELVAHRAELFVELKGAAIEEAVLQCLRRHPGPFAVHSFDHDAIERVAAAAPTVRRGLLFDAPPAGLASYIARAGAHDVWPRQDVATPGFIAEAHALGARVIAWTVNDPAVGAALIAAGVDAICTDDVRWLARIQS